MPQLVPLLPEMNTRCWPWPLRFCGGDGLRKLAGTPASTLPCSRRIEAARAIEMAPIVRRDGFSGGPLAYDGQLIDDARLVTAVARTAAEHGARILTRVAASNVTGTLVTLPDQRSGEPFDVSARAVVNAFGVWAGEVDPSIRLRPSRGTHPVFDAKASAIPLPRSLFRSRRDQPVRVRDAGTAGLAYTSGLTDEDAPGPIPDVPEPTQQEICSCSTPSTSRWTLRGACRRDRLICWTSAADRRRRRPARPTCRVSTPSSS